MLLQPSQIIRIQRITERSVMKSWASMPKNPSSSFTPPWIERASIQMPAITTHERKWGRYDMTCTYFLNPQLLTCVSMMAKIRKNGNSRMYFMKLMIRVFLRMLKNAGLLKIISK